VLRSLMISPPIRIAAPRIAVALFRIHVTILSLLVHQLSDTSGATRQSRRSNDSKVVLSVFGFLAPILDSFSHAARSLLGGPKTLRSYSQAGAINRFWNAGSPNLRRRLHEH
jgi:hypothetical protein